MREILFKGKRVDNGEWITGYYIKANHHWHSQGIHEDWIVVDTIQNGGWCNVRGKYAVIPETIGQYIGLTDKNDKKIFEGDIIKLCREDYDWAENKVYIEEEINVINFDKGSFYLDFSYSSDGYNEISCLYEEIIKNGEVIGNICDNPELINN